MRKRNDSRLVCDCAAFLRISYFWVIKCAVSCTSPETSDKEDNARSQMYLDSFMETRVLPEFIEDFCLDILTFRRLVTSQKGELVIMPNAWITTKECKCLLKRSLEST